MKNNRQIKFQTPDFLGIRMELIKIKAFLQTIGNPQNKIPQIVHIAGTNGKGSTLAFLQKLLKGTQLKVGKYISPHLIELTERFSINGQNIAACTLKEYQVSFENLADFRNLTYFEQLTVIAFKYFADQKIDLLLLETGMGGRLDATNVCDQITLSLITNIGLDHQEFLGETIEQIALEKAGILKTGTPFMTTAAEPALKFIRQQALKVQAPEIPLESFDLSQQKLGLAGHYQKNNAQLALNAYAYLQSKLNLLNKNWQSQLAENIDYQGRFQQIQYQQKHIILDGAHNVSAALALRESLPKNTAELVYLVGFLKTKDYRSFLKALLPINSQNILVLTNAADELTSADLGAIQDFLDSEYPHLKIIVKTKIHQAWQVFTEHLSNGKTGLVTGSLYLIGKILALIS
jgi:dihydrofolate synthase/folylpolyglutamate synthase